MRHHAAGARLVEVDTSRAATAGLLRAKGTTLRVVLAMLFHGILQNVVIPGHVRRDEDGRPAAAGHDHGARGVDAVAIFAHGGGDARASLLPLDAPLFVAHAPQDDGGMVAVAANHALQEVDVLAVHARQAVFLNDQNAQRVAGSQHLRRHGVMGSAVGIAAELLELFQPVGLEGVGDAAPYARMVLVHVHALQLHMLAVQEEAFVWVECDVTDADGGSVGIDQTVARIDLRIYIIYIRRFRRPQVGVLHRHLHGGSALLFGRKAENGRVAGHEAHFAPFFVLQRMLQVIVCESQPVILHRGLNVQHGLTEVSFLGENGRNKGTERNHMERGRFVEPDVAVNAGPFVKPALFQRGIGTDTHQVFATIIQVLRDVIHLRGIAAGLITQVETVDPHAGIAENAVEL